MLANIFGKVKSTKDDIAIFLFGAKNKENEDEIQLTFANKSILKSNGFLPNGKAVHNAANPADQFNENFPTSRNMDCSRNLVIESSTLFRKGPVPIEFLSHREQNRLSRRGCMKEWDDSNQATSDNHLDFQNPSSKSLLSYFGRLGSGEDDSDTINLGFIESLLNAGADFNYPDVYGQSIFFAVARDWHIDVAKYAIECGAKVNFRDQYGRSPLHLAAAVNYSEMVEFLLLNGADITAKSFGEEQTPLHYAARYNSLEAMKILIHAGAMIDSVDFLRRTPLQIASEIGSTDAVKYLLKLGAPAGLYDNLGNSTMFFMVEMMPKLAFEGLNQFFVEDNSMTRRYFYLDQLEYDMEARSLNSTARTVLQGIVTCNELNLILHPAIQKLIDVKWKLFGKKHAIISNFENILYALLATVLAFSSPYARYDEQFTPVKEKIWKIVIAAIFFILTFYFWIKQILFVRLAGAKDKSYKEHRLNCIKKQYPYAHPAWSEEKEYFDGEVFQLRRQKSTFWNDYWNVFELVSLLLVVIQFILHGWNFGQPNRDLFKAAKLVSAISLLLIWFRLYKTLRIFKIFAELTVLLDNLIMVTLKFFLLFMDFYIPFIFFYYMMFGGSNEDAKLTKSNNRDTYLSMTNVAYNVWTLTIKASYDKNIFTSVDPVAGQLAIAIYFTFMTVVFFNVYVGHLSEVFSRLHRTVNAKASMLIATLIVNYEYKMELKEKRNQKRYMRNFCGPMVVPFEEGYHGMDDRQSISIGIDHLAAKVDDITRFLGKASFAKDNMNSIKLYQLDLLQTDFEKLLHKQNSLATELENGKTKLTDSQKRTIDMIKADMLVQKNKRMTGSLVKNLPKNTGSETE